MLALKVFKVCDKHALLQLPLAGISHKLTTSAQIQLPVLLKYHQESFSPSQPYTRGVGRPISRAAPQYNIYIQEYLLLKYFLTLSWLMEVLWIFLIVYAPCTLFAKTSRHSKTMLAWSWILTVVIFLFCVTAFSFFCGRSYLQSMQSDSPLLSCLWMCIKRIAAQ